MLIAVDIDEVLAEFTAAFRLFLRRNKGIMIKPRDLKTADWWRAWGKTKEESVDVIFEFLHSDEAGAIRPKRGALTALRLLKKAGHRFVTITGRPAEIEHRTRHWVEKNFPGIFDHIYCTDFHIVNHGKRSKGSICKQIGADILIDDYPGYAAECIANGMAVLLFESPWNHGFKTVPGLKRVRHWREAEARIRTLARGKRR